MQKLGRRRIPVDGQVVSGHSFAEESAIRLGCQPSSLGIGSPVTLLKRSKGRSSRARPSRDLRVTSHLRDETSGHYRRVAFFALVAAGALTLDAQRLISRLYGKSDLGRSENGSLKSRFYREGINSRAARGSGVKHCTVICPRKTAWPTSLKRDVGSLCRPGFGRWCVDGIRQGAQIETAYASEFGRTWEGLFQT